MALDPGRASDWEEDRKGLSFVLVIKMLGVLGFHMAREITFAAQLAATTLDRALGLLRWAIGGTTGKIDGQSWEVVKYRDAYQDADLCEFLN